MERQQVIEGLEALQPLQEKLARLEEFYMMDKHGSRALSMLELIEWASDRIDKLQIALATSERKKRNAEQIIASDARKERVLAMISGLFRSAEKGEKSDE